VVRILALMIVALLSASCKQSSPLRLTETANDTVAILEDNLPNLMRENNVAGIGIAVIRDGQITLVQSFGTSDQITNTAIGSDTVFEVASLGKPVFAYLAVKLAHEGLYDLDCPPSAPSGQIGLIA